MSFDELYEQHNRYVGYLLRNIYSKEDREDLSQQVGLTVGQKIDKIETGKEKAFIKHVTGNIIGNYITKESKRKEAMKNYKEMIELAEKYDNTTAFLAIVDELEDKLLDWQFQYIMWFIQGVSQQEIAKYTGSTQSRVSTCMKKAILAAQTALAE